MFLFNTLAYVTDKLKICIKKSLVAKKRQIYSSLDFTIYFIITVHTNRIPVDNHFSLEGRTMVSLVTILCPCLSFNIYILFCNFYLGHLRL